MTIEFGSAVAIIGAGTMGEGIAQVAATAGQPVLLIDNRPGAAAAARERVAAQLGKQVAKGRLTEDGRGAIIDRLRTGTDTAEISSERMVVEAIVEDLPAKQALFRAVERLVSSDTVLASNTSSISITAIARVLDRPERFAGLHFFNPAPLMPLVEVISGLATDPAVADTLVELMCRWNKCPVRAHSTPGFIVNRIARPFYAEALRLLQEQAAAPETLDAVVRDVGSYRMGPFALMDLIGNDVNFAVTSSMYQAWFSEPRYQPSVIQKELVDAGRFGRKSGIGFFDYRECGSPPVGEDYVTKSSAPSRVTVGTEVDPVLVSMIADAGIAIDQSVERGTISWNGLRLCLTDGRSATERARDESSSDLVLYDLVPDWHRGTAVALTAADQCRPFGIDEAAALFAALAKTVHVIADRPGMVLARIVAMLVNEGAEAVLQGVASGSDIDQAMRLGANHPFGPLEVSDRLGADWIVSMLDNLAATYGEDRYRVSSLLRRMAAAGGTFHKASA